MAPGENLAGAGAELAGEHDQRPRPGDGRVGIVVGSDAAVGVFDLHHRPVVEEQAGEADRFGQRAAAVEAQVEHHGVDALLLKSSRMRLTSRVVLLKSVTPRRAPFMSM